MQDVWSWLRAICAHWKAAVTGSLILTVLVGAWERAHPEKVLSARYFLLLVAAFFIVASFRAWQSEHRARVLIETTRPRAVVSVEVRGLAVYLSVKNTGGGALFYATFRTSDHRRSDAHFVQWTHTKDIKTVIPSGAAFEARLAEFRIDATKQWWHYFAVTEGGAAGADSHYSVPGAIPRQVANAVVLSGLVMSEPDLLGGPAPYEHVLEPSGPKSEI